MKWKTVFFSLLFLNFIFTLPNQLLLYTAIFHSLLRLISYIHLCVCVYIYIYVYIHMYLYFCFSFYYLFCTFTSQFLAALLLILHSHGETFTFLSETIIIMSLVFSFYQRLKTNKYYLFLWLCTYYSPQIQIKVLDCISFFLCPTL